MPLPSGRGSQPIGDILSELFARRGYGRMRSTAMLEETWRTVAGPRIAQATRVGALRGGTLEILVSSSAVLQELAGFLKQSLVRKLQDQAGSDAIRDLRFRLVPRG